MLRSVPLEVLEDGVVATPHDQVGLLFELLLLKFLQGVLTFLSSRVDTYEWFVAILVIEDVLLLGDDIIHERHVAQLHLGAIRVVHHPTLDWLGGHCRVVLRYELRHEGGIREEIIDLAIGRAHLVRGVVVEVHFIGCLADLLVLGAVVGVGLLDGGHRDALLTRLQLLQLVDDLAGRDVPILGLFCDLIVRGCTSYVPMKLHSGTVFLHPKT